LTGLRAIGAALAAALSFTPCAAGIAAPVRLAAEAPKIDLIIESRNGIHRFRVEVAKTHLEQERGLMYRTDIPPDGGMLFAPYPAEGGRSKEARFWMHNTPTPLDIIFIRTDGTIEKIVSAEAYNDDRVYSDGPVSAVLEINAGRAAALGIAVGDKVNWQGRRG
jgi:uncharacterized membrane protein (UPF0127 family)